MILGPDGTKMSKSRGNIIEPDEYIAKYGSDILRLYMLFGFNYLDGGAWNDTAFHSTVRYVDRVTNLINICKNAQKIFKNAKNCVKNDENYSKNDRNLLIKLNKTIKFVTENLENFSFNTAVARCMELTNALYDYAAKGEIPSPNAVNVPKANAPKNAVNTLKAPVNVPTSPVNAQIMCETLNKLVLLLAPMLPHFGEEWFHTLNKNSADSVFNQSFPAPDPQYLIEDEIEIAVQINSKIVARIVLPADADQETAESLSKGIIGGQSVKKVIYVKNRLINFIV
jgi:leucyl-tRNA synthetase